MGKLSNGMSALGRGLAAMAEKITPTELKLENIGKPVEVTIWVRDGGGAIEPASRIVYAGRLKGYSIFSDGFDIELENGQKIEAGFKSHRVEMSVA